MARKIGGKYTVSGPGEDGSAASLGAAISLACTFATRHRKEMGELTYYVRDVAGQGFGGVTKHPDGIITVAVAAS